MFLSSFVLTYFFLSLATFTRKDRISTLSLPRPGLLPTTSGMRVSHTIDVLSVSILLVRWLNLQKEAFFGNATPELTRYGPVVTVRFTRFNTQKFYVLSTECMYLKII